MRNNSFLFQGLIVLILLWVFIVGILLQLEYGTDVDSWYVAGNAFDISEQGQYFASRPPGFPVYELILSILIPLGGYLMSNLFSAFWAIILGICLFLQLKKEEIPVPLLACTSMLAFPLFIIAASSTLDYLPALSLMWISYYLLYAACKEDGNITFLYISACALGISAGFRLTALGFLLPALIFLWKENRRIKEMGTYVLLVLLASSLAFLPVLLGPGLHVPLGQSILSFSYHIQVFIYNGIMFWGMIPLLILALGLYVLFQDLRKNKLRPNKTYASSDAFHISVLVIYSGLLLLLPDESSYLLPILPSSLLLIHRYFRPQIRLLFFLGIVLTHVANLELKGGESGQRKLSPHFEKGICWQNYIERNRRINLREAVNKAAPDQKTLLMMEMPWVSRLSDEWKFDKMLGHYKKEGSLFYFGPYIFDREEVLQKKEAGYRLCVWKAQKWEYYALGLEDYFGKEIEVVELNDIIPLAP